MPWKNTKKPSNSAKEVLILILTLTFTFTFTLIHIHIIHIHILFLILFFFFDSEEDIKFFSIVIVSDMFEWILGVDLHSLISLY
jgi:hypothetical protein